MFWWTARNHLHQTSLHTFSQSSYMLHWWLCVRMDVIIQIQTKSLSSYKLLAENTIDMPCPLTVIPHDTASIKRYDLTRFSKCYDLFWCLRDILQHRWWWIQFYWISSLIWVLCMYSLSKAESLLQLIIILNTAPGYTAKPAINYHKLSAGLHASGSCIVSKVVRWR